MVFSFYRAQVAVAGDEKGGRAAASLSEGSGE